MGARVLILVDNAGGGTFDQAFRDAWRFLKQFGVCSDSSIGRGQRDVSDELAAAAVFVNVVVMSLHAHCFNSTGGIRSGLSQTSSFNSQLRVERDQRCGLRALA
ncbi:hypothetical protein QFZ91_005085 [Paraburkholderia sp. JPY419]